MRSYFLTAGPVSWGAAVFFLSLDRGLKVLSGQLSGEWGLLRFGAYLNERYFFAWRIPVLLGQLAVTMALVGLLWLVIKWWRQKSVNYQPVLWLTILGAMSNVYDRWVYGGVLDYFEIGMLPVFNLADLMIVGGLAVWWIIIYRDQRYEH